MRRGPTLGDRPFLLYSRFGIIPWPATGKDAIQPVPRHLAMRGLIMPPPAWRPGAMTGPPDSAAGASRRAGGSGQGFTLVELLVVLALLGLVSVALVGALRFGLRAWDTGERRVEQLNRVQAVQAFLRRRIQQATLLQSGAPDAAATLADGAGLLGFIAPLPAHLGVGGPHMFSLRLEAGADRRGLILDWWLDRPEASEPIDPASAGTQLVEKLGSRVAIAELRQQHGPWCQQIATVRERL